MQRSAGVTPALPPISPSQAGRVGKTPAIRARGMMSEADTAGRLTEPGLDLGAAPAPHGAGYRVLARKYRPATFDDLIGQEAMVRTLSNAFEAGRIPQAWILTGVRGVGKTTTAR